MSNSGRLREVHTDIRRTLMEYNGEDFAVTAIAVHQRVPLGNHYHEKKTETFVITKGRGVVFTKSIDDSAAQIEAVSLHEGVVVHVPPRTAHTFILDPGSTLTCYSSARFDEDDQDMVSYELLFPVGHVSATLLVYRESDPRQIYIDLKDDGLPIKAFRRTLCPLGGNWVGDGARKDKNPAETLRRELEEELSFEKARRDSIELKHLGLGDAEMFDAVKVSSALVTEEDEKDLAHLKRVMCDQMAPFGDYIVHVSRQTLDAADPGNSREGFTYLTSYFMVGLSEDNWSRIERLQKKFGNLSNESISMITSLTEIVVSQTACAYGHEHGLGDFFIEIAKVADQPLPILSGTSGLRIGSPCDSYTQYLQQFEVARKP